MKGVSLRVLEGEFAVWRLPPNSPPPPLDDTSFLSVTRTAAELSVVGPAGMAQEGAAVEAGWACLAVLGPLPFELTGVLAGISAPLAAAEVPIFVVSTFDTDYVLVRSADLERALAALKAAGHSVER